MIVSELKPVPTVPAYKAMFGHAGIRAVQPRPSCQESFIWEEGRGLRLHRGGRFKGIRRGSLRQRIRPELCTFNAIGAVADAGGGQRAVQAHFETPHRRQRLALAQGSGEQRGGAHGANGMRTGRADTDLEKVEHTDSHAGLRDCRGIRACVVGVAAPPPAIPAHHRAFPEAGRIRHRPGHVQKRRVRARIGEPLRPGGRLHLHGVGMRTGSRRSENGIRWSPAKTTMIECDTAGTECDPPALVATHPVGDGCVLFHDRSRIAR